MNGIPVLDPFGATADPRMPFLSRALDPLEARRQLERCCPSLLGPEGGGRGQLRLRAIRVTRYKPGRRCLIQYDLEVQWPEGRAESVTLFGKVQAQGLNGRTLRLLKLLRKAGFGGDSPDGISVPKPIGKVPGLQMWLQRKVPGVPATGLLPEPGGVALAGRIAEAIHKLHMAGVPSQRRHTMADELRILHQRLGLVAETRPEWAGRLDRLLERCDRVGAALPEPTPRGIHRDFYADQVIVDRERLYLVDLDLYREGDPGLDAGNFLGHLTEQGLRTLGNAEALADQERAFEERFVELSGEETRASLRTYAALTLVRHIYLSTQFPDRRPSTPLLLELSEERLGAPFRNPVGQAKRLSRY